MVLMLLEFSSSFTSFFLCLGLGLVCLLGELLSLLKSLSLEFGFFKKLLSSSFDFLFFFFNLFLLLSHFCLNLLFHRLLTCLFCLFLHLKQVPGLCLLLGFLVHHLLEVGHHLFLFSLLLFLLFQILNDSVGRGFVFSPLLFFYQLLLLPRLLLHFLLPLLQSCFLGCLLLSNFLLDLFFVLLKLLVMLPFELFEFSLLFSFEFFLFSL